MASDSADETQRLLDTQTHAYARDQCKGNTNWMHCVSLAPNSIIPGPLEDNFRIRNVEKHAQIVDVLLEHSSDVIHVSESAHLCHILSQDHDENTVI